MLHPLYGSDLRTLIRTLGANGGVPRNRLALAAGLSATALLRAPASAAERGYVRARARRVPPSPAPIFVLGHWRSGTTHLYNMLSCLAGLGYVGPVATGLPWNFLLVGRALGPLLRHAIPAERYIDGMAVTPTAPQEDEIGLANMTPLSYYHGIYFPSRFRENLETGLFFDNCGEAEIAHWKRQVRHFVDKVSLQFDGRPVVIKNPAHTAKVERLLEIWPQARFVHIVRNPYHVFLSTRRFFRRLLALLALQPFDGVEIDEAIYAIYPRMMEACLAATAQLPDDRFVEIRFEELERDPLGQLRRIDDRLRLGAGDDLAAALRGYLESTATYRKRTTAVPGDVAAEVGRRWQRYLDHWHYAPAAE